MNECYVINTFNKFKTLQFSKATSPYIYTVHTSHNQHKRELFTEEKNKVLAMRSFTRKYPNERCALILIEKKQKQKKYAKKRKKNSNKEK